MLMLGCVMQLDQPQLIFDAIRQSVFPRFLGLLG